MTGRVQGSVLTVRQERRRFDIVEGARYCDEVARTEPDRRRATRHDQRGRLRRSVAYSFSL